MSSQPPAQVPLTTWYFQMFAPPARPPRPLPDGVHILRVEHMPVHFYRYLYDIIGSPWVWWERKQQTPERIREDIHHPDYEVCIPYLNGVPVGLAELDYRTPHEVQLNYFGIVPDYIGRRLGGSLLDWTVQRAFSRGIQRYWLHTCSFDSPAAVPCYQSAGFTQYHCETTLINDPRAQ